MNNDNKTTREAALEWWNNQTPEYQVLQFNQYKQDTFTPARRSSELTGREIEKIYSDLRLSEKAIHPQTEHDPGTFPLDIPGLKPEVLEGNKGDILAKWYLIPNSFKPMGELRDCIMVEMEMNVINDLEEENKSLREANERMKEALKWIDKKSFGFIHWTDMDEINSKAKEALQANPNK